MRYRFCLPIALLMAFAVLATCTAAPRPAAPSRPGTPTPRPTAYVRLPPARSVILLIGDGMAGPQMYAARAFRGVDTGVPIAKLNMDAMPVLGTYDNRSADSLVTDAAAVATAIATGVRVPTHYLSMDADGKPLPTILEQARASGRSTGLVTTVTVSNAVPAAFAAHAKERSEEFEVAAQFADKGTVDVLLGGGRMYFLPSGTESGQRKDGRNLAEELKSRGYVYVENREGLAADKGSARLLGLFDATAMAYEIDRDPGKQPSLAEMTEAALRSLSRNPKGFFLMVEGGKIDWACHGNDLAAAARDTLAFDDAVGIALEYNRSHPDTLVIVTGGHETGGLSFPSGFDPQALKQQHASVEHVLESLPVRDLDPNNNDFLTALRQGLGIDADVPLREKLKLAQGKPRELLYLLSSVLSARCRASFSTTGHTALPPVLSARGPGQATFGGSYDVVDIYPRIAKQMGMTPRAP